MRPLTKAGVVETSKTLGPEGYGYFLRERRGPPLIIIIIIIIVVDGHSITKLLFCSVLQLFRRPLKL
ncbi:hypothetical protein BDZ91DRAFT_750403 [Kalaharituber pfeilii]|nr:hypothetical protein BDZ91DRAFT_750403 [Kalaharituber pfeilii]